jgi:hypothetical protein
MRHLVAAAAALALTMFLPAPSSAEIVKDVATTLRYNTTQPPVGWFALNSAALGFPTDTVFLWPASKGVAKALGKLTKGVDHACLVEYDPDIVIAGGFGVYVHTYKVKCQ